MKKFWIAISSVFGVLLIIYLGTALFFMNHFFINTTINGKDFSGKSMADVENFLADMVNNYELSITDKTGIKETIKGVDVGLAYAGNEGVRELLDRQQAFMWPASFYNNDVINAQIEVSYDKNALADEIAGLKAIKAVKIPSGSAHPVFNGSKYVIKPEIIGTELNMTALRGKVREAIINFRHVLDLEAENCYVLPRYDRNSPKVIRACDELNKYVGASITYTMTEDEVVDGSVIFKWLRCDDEMKVTFDESAVKSWLTDFGDKYDTVGTTRKIVTPYGAEKEVSGGTYGWSINEIEELPILIDHIKNGETVVKEPVYYQKGAAHSPQDWGTTYAEVDISKQHMWYIKDGKVMMESDVITGLPTPKKATKTGVFDILEMKRNNILVGEINPVTKEPEYRTFVNYWMRVTWSGVGFHDALWQPGFGGRLYTYRGSHGCINMPYGKAGTLYGMITVGTPVIIHN